MHKVKSVFLTFMCAGMILGTGYLVIVESGQKVLEKERILEESLYEDTSSNIFYGKIEEDIELFPWSYYPNENSPETTGNYPRFQQVAMETYGEWDEDLEEELKEMQNWYLYQMIGWQSETPAEEVEELYRNSSKSIMDSMVMVDNPPYGPSTVYFYKDIMQLGEKNYQIRIACSDWNIISFNCAEYQEGKERDREAWSEGKEKLVEILEKSETELAEYYRYMMILRNQELAVLYDATEGYINTYQQSLYWLGEIMAGKDYGVEDISEEVHWLMKELETRNAVGEKELPDKEYTVEMVTNAESSYSYQIVELKDMILLLMQGEETLGIFYDPIEQRFCGYNFFYEY